MTDWLEELLEESGEMLRWGAKPYLAAAEWKEDDAASDSGDHTAARKRLDAETDAAGELDPESGWDPVVLWVGDVTRSEKSASAVWAGEDLLESGRSWPGSGDGSALYQRLVQAGRSVWAVRPMGQSAAAEQQSTGTPSLTVDELDRAVRRDSRRYDGAMELY